MGTVIIKGNLAKCNLIKLWLKYNICISEIVSCIFNIKQFIHKTRVLTTLFLYD